MMRFSQEIREKCNIIGVGTDICTIKRIEKLFEKFGEKFLNRVYTDYEKQIFKSLSEHKRMGFLAKRFAAKEACVKALGTGFGEYAHMNEVEILKTDKGQPYIKLYGRALETAKKQVFDKEFEILLSLSDEKEEALAFCLFITSHKTVMQ